jgi:hypothetical protein
LEFQELAAKLDFNNTTLFSGQSQSNDHGVQSTHMPFPAIHKLEPPHGKTSPQNNQQHVRFQLSLQPSTQQD